MELANITRTMTGSSDMNCLVLLEVINNRVFFDDMTRGLFFEVDTQDKLNQILEYNTFES